MFVLEQPPWLINVVPVSINPFCQAVFSTITVNKKWPYRGGWNSCPSRRCLKKSRSKLFFCSCDKSHGLLVLQFSCVNDEWFGSTARLANSILALLPIIKTKETCSRLGPYDSSVWLSSTDKRAKNTWSWRQMKKMTKKKRSITFFRTIDRSITRKTHYLYQTFTGERLG